MLAYVYYTSGGYFKGDKILLINKQTLFEKIYNNGYFWSHLVYTYICTYIHTYIIGHYKSSVRIMDLVSYNPYVVCVNFIHTYLSGGNYSLKSTPNDRFFEILHGNFIYFRVFSEICLEEVTEEFLFYIFVLMSDLRFEPWSYVY